MSCFILKAVRRRKQKFTPSGREGESVVKELMTVTEVSKEYGVSARMLRHYEKLGLLCSMRKEEYAYRVYSERDVARLRQILVLRKLRIPLKEIREILEDPGASAAIAVLERNLASLDQEAKALAAVRDILSQFLDALRVRMLLPAGEVLLSDNRLLELADSLSPSATQLQKERKQIEKEELTMAEQTRNAMNDVRIVHLPAATVAAAHVIDDDPEDKAGVMIADFARENRLWEKLPGLRLYGFNHPNPKDETGVHGYEFWVTIPEDLEVPPPLQKKYFPGGTYAAHMIQMGNFHEWAWLDQWVKTNGEYDYCGNGDPEVMYGSLEEHLNYHDHIQATPRGEPETTQLDLLIPVKKR